MFDRMTRKPYSSTDRRRIGGHLPSRVSSQTSPARLRRIAVVLPQLLHWSRQVMGGISTFARQNHSWSLQWFSPAQALLQSLAEWQPDGVLAFCNSEGDARELLAICPRMIAVKSPATIPGVSAVTVNHHAVGEMAADHFVRRGLRSFACVSLQDSAFGEPRAKGFANFLLERGNAHYKTIRHPLPHGEQEVKLRENDEFCNWLKSAPKPLGLFAVDDRLGVEACEICRELQVRVPDDVAVLGADDDAPLCNIADPSLSSVHTPLVQVGFEAAQLLDSMFGQQKFTPQTRRLNPIQVTTRESCGVLAVDDPDIAEVWCRIHAMKDQPLSVKTLLKDLSISRRTLEQRFRAAIGCGLMEEVRRVRDQHAVEMLIKSDLPIWRIAKECGFGSAVHLSVAFRRSHGVSPRHFREQSRLMQDPPAQS